MIGRDGTRGPEGPGFVSRLAPYRYLPHVVLGVLIVVYGVRAFYRNYVWHTDVTLWTNAQVKSPKSFRSYQSLAFALFEQDAVGNCDRMIDIDEQGLTIVDDLPNPNNSSRLYLHLGMYYGLKGDILSKQDPQRGLIVTEAARPWLEKSAGILERGMPIDRAFNEVNRGRDVKRGRNGQDTPDVGLAPVYGYLGDAYKRLGSCELYTRDFRLKLLDQAERTYRYMRHLEPTDADAYFKMASLQVYSAQVQNNREKLEEAAVSLMQCILLDANNQNAWQLLNEVFKQLNTEPYPCIVVNSDGRAQLDLSRSLVRATVLQGYRDFVKIFLMAKRPKLAESARDTAVNQYHFEKEIYFDPLFDPTYLKQFGIPVPPDPIFYKPKPVKFEMIMPDVKKAFVDAIGRKDIETLNVDIVDGRAQYWLDTTIDGKMWRVRVSEEGKLLSKEPVSAK